MFGSVSLCNLTEKVAHYNGLYDGKNGQNSRVKRLHLICQNLISRKIKESETGKCNKANVKIAFVGN